MSTRKNDTVHLVMSLLLKSICLTPLILNFEIISTLSIVYFLVLSVSKVSWVLCFFSSRDIHFSCTVAGKMLAPHHSRYVDRSQVERVLILYMIYSTRMIKPWGKKQKKRKVIINDSIITLYLRWYNNVHNNFSW